MKKASNTCNANQYAWLDTGVCSSSRQVGSYSFAYLWFSHDLRQVARTIGCASYQEVVVQLLYWDYLLPVMRKSAFFHHCVADEQQGGAEGLKGARRG